MRLRSHGQPAHTILLADDHLALLEGVRDRINRERGLRIVGTATDGEEALSLALDLRPDLLLLDMSMPSLSGLNVMRQLVDQSAPRILPLSGHDHPEFVLGALDGGASGYLLKEESLTTIVEAVWTVLEGGTFISGKILENLGSYRLDRRETPESSLVNLGFSPGLVRVLVLLSNGHTNKEIADLLHRSENTVRNHLSKIRRLVTIRERAGIVAWSWRNGYQAVDQSKLEELWKQRRGLPE